jgi:hypothetical protein
MAQLPDAIQVRKMRVPRNRQQPEAVQRKLGSLGGHAAKRALTAERVGHLDIEKVRRL